MSDYIQLNNISKIFGKQIGKDRDFPESVGAIIETIEFIPYMSAYQNLVDIAAMRGNLSKVRIKEVLEMVGLENVGRKHVSKFSMGMRQRLGIAQAIMEDPDILLLDEPLNGLLSLKEKGKLIILASHSKEDIQILCDTVFRMDHGKIIATEIN